MKSKYLVLLSTALVFAGFAVSAMAEEYPLKKKESKELVKLVEQAADLVDRKGEAAFAEFRKKGSRWYDGDRYVFVITKDGVEKVNPAFAHLEDQDIKGMKDAYGKPLAGQIIAKAFPGGKPGRGWSHYLWPKPGALEPSWKTSYVVGVKAPSGKLYAVGSGCHDMPMERVFVVEKVRAAKKLIAEKGEAAFDTLRRRDGEFLFKDSYVFVNSDKGVELVNPAFPGLEGRNLWRFNNAEGRPVVQEYIALAKKKGKGWIGYYWHRPGSKKNSIKHTYVEGVSHNGKFYVVGCGAYLD